VSNLSSFFARRPSAHVQAFFKAKGRRGRHCAPFARLLAGCGPEVNLGKSGVTSIALGVRGAHMTFGRYGRRATLGLPGSGLSYSVYERHYRPQPRASPLVAVVLVLAALLALAVIFGR
jgi:Protein of unknown function (DUF4236)